MLLKLIDYIINNFNNYNIIKFINIKLKIIDIIAYMKVK